MTTGELARLVDARRAQPGKVHVVAMKGWRRAMLWPDTGRAWPVPSPNLRTFDAALAYGGVALVEATSASEGRGTDTPFQLVGAPALDRAPMLEVSAPGFSLTPATFTPRRSTAAVNPKHTGVACQGVKVAVSQARAARPYQLGIGLLRALRGNPAAHWKTPTALDELLGTRKVRAALERGDSVAAIVGADAAEHEAFMKERAKALLY
jgi:uncharacterized protein YbbC (DUF1343 family)